MNRLDVSLFIYLFIYLFVKARLDRLKNIYLSAISEGRIVWPSLAQEILTLKDVGP
jgi:hypothetical protein